MRDYLERPTVWGIRGSETPRREPKSHYFFQVENGGLFGLHALIDRRSFSPHNLNLSTVGSGASLVTPHCHVEFSSADTKFYIMDETAVAAFEFNVSSDVYPLAIS